MTDFYGDSGNNTFNVTIADGTSNVDGFDGSDTLNINWSGLSSQIYGYWFGSSSSGYLYDYASSATIGFNNIENLSILLGSSSDSFSVGGNYSSISLNFGGGLDTFSGDFNVWNSALTLNGSAGVYALSGTGVNVTNFESFTISGSAVADSFTLGTVVGSVSINGQGGSDSMFVDWSGRSSPLTGYWTTGSGYIIDYGTGEQINFSSIELPTILFGNADDSFQMTSGGEGIVLDFGAGTDSFYGDLSAVASNLILDLTGATFSLTGTGVSVTNFEVWSGQTGGGNDTLLGSAGNDILIAGGGANTINAGDGSDTIYSTAPGIDTVNGGSGTDYWSGSFTTAASGITITQTAGAAYSLSNGGSLIDIEYVNISGSNFTDTFSAVSSGGLYTQATFNGADGVDSIIIDWSASTTYSYFVVDGSGNGYGYGDYYSGYDYVSANNVENYNITFGSGADSFTRYLNSAAVHVDVDGGDGLDSAVIDYASMTTGITFALASGGATSTVVGQGDTLTNFEVVSVTGGSGNDSLTGGSLADTLRGNGGNNTLNGGDGDDIIYTSNGGIDTVNGGAGADTWSADFSTLASGITMTQTGTSSYSLSNGGSVANVEMAQIQGTAFNDAFAGLSTGGHFNGGDGGDTLSINWSDATTYSYFVIDSAGNSYGYKDYYAASNYLSATSIETVNLTFGAGDDTLTRYYSTLYPTTRANVSGGAGTDVLTLDYSDMATGITFALGSGGATATVVGQGDTYSSFETLNITGGSGNDSFTGGALADTLTGGAGTNTLNGGGGDDTIYTTAAATDTVDGGAGTDTWSADFSARASGITVTQTSASSYTLSNGGSVTNVEAVQIQGTEFNDAFSGVSSGGYFNGRGGADSITINWSDATTYSYFVFDGTNGYGYKDYYSGGGYLSSSSIETINLTFGSGNDAFTRYYNAAYATTLVSVNAGAGSDMLTADYSAMTTGISFSLANGGGTVAGHGDTYTNFETMTFSAGSGNDTLEGGAGDDTLSGGTGFDTLSYEHATAAVSINLAIAGGQGQVTGGAGTDYISNDFEGLRGSAFNDTLVGSDVANTIEGGAGNDIMSGGLGIDTVSYEHAAGGIQVNLGLASAQNTLGAGTDTLSSFENVIGSVYADIFSGNSVANVFDGRGGSDTVDYSAANSAVTVSLAVTTAQAIGGGQGNDTLLAIENLRGSSYNDSLTGNASDNLLDGGSGADAMAGGTGSDNYVVDNSGDVVTESASAGTDTVTAAISYALTANVENLALTGSSNINGTGNSLNNTITGNSGNNVIDGGAGADAMAGGAGNDTYLVDDAGDIVTEASSAGADTVNASVTHVLAANVEHLVLTGAGNINGTGNGLDNTITGNSGNNVIDGGAGADAMVGGAGNDTYVVDNAGDTVTEGNGAGTDTVNASVSFSLVGQFLENLTLTGASNINATGNGFNNVIVGNSGSNVLDGGAGVDTMAGGAGDDTYVIDNAGDTVTEAANAGLDTVNASVSFSLGGQFLENLTLTSTGNINGTGNSSANVITGNSGNNVIDGGSGADTMAGGAGNDTYIVDNAGDTVTEGAGAGIDTVNAAVSYTLGTNVENLTLTGSASTNATGNSLNNTITGNSGNNVLDGGAGADTMLGGLGDDTYHVDNAGDVVTENASEGIDTIYASISTTLASNAEILRLTGAADIGGIGTAGADQIFGNSGNNVLTGLGGDDVLDGGAGSDTADYSAATSAITVSLEVAAAQAIGGGQGTDTLIAIENLIGSAFADTMTGNGADNRLDGGAGADTMSGGAGNDTYVIDNSGDRVTEANGAGTDTILSSISYSLAGQFLENLTLTGSANANATGNSFANVIVGNAGNNVIDGGTGADTMSGGLGNDAYYVDSVGDIVTEIADAGTDTVSTGLSYALGANLENLTLTGTGNVNGTGNSLNNTIIGNSGNNVIDGGLGADTMSGGAGNDTYYVDHAGDTIVEANGAGTDQVNAAVSFTLAGQFLENLTLVGTGNINGTGNSFANILTGNAGNNVIDGGAGTDAMAGGAGNDTYYVDNAGDTVTEGNVTGVDHVYSAINFTLAGQFLENLTLTGSTNSYGLGNSFANVITGNSGNNLIDGGAGADTLIGGGGNDTYIIDNVGDVVTEDSGAGTDTIQTSVNYILSANVENLTMTGSSNVSGTGNSMNNIITGNSGNNDFNGGAGADTMSGGAGNDVYFVDNSGDVVVEANGAGRDSVMSYISYNLSGQFVEDAYLVGTGDDSLTGNGLDNVLSGNAGMNSIAGGAGNDSIYGGLGADTLSGGTGADIFGFNSTLGGGNIDTISDFAVSDDTIYLSQAMFGGLAAGTLGASAFAIAAAAPSADTRIFYNSATGGLFYDVDGSGAGAATQFAILNTGLALTNADFVVA